MQDICPILSTLANTNVCVDQKVLGPAGRTALDKDGACVWYTIGRYDYISLSCEIQVARYAWRWMKKTADPVRHSSLFVLCIRARLRCSTSGEMTGMTRVLPGVQPRPLPP